MLDLSRRAIMAGALSAASGCAAAQPFRLTVRADRPLGQVPRDFTGLSVETVQFGDPGFYNPDNRSLVALLRRLSLNGVLRVGGNSSEFCWWKARPDAGPPPIQTPPGVGRTDNWMPQHFNPITPDAVEALRGFLDACGWTCIWGLNLGTGTPERDAEEAAFVARTLGPRLQHFQIGNEPELYIQPTHRIRPAAWGFDDYMKEWGAIAEAVSRRVPDARFGGADGAPEWAVRFAEAAPARFGDRIVGLSGHYYAEGPPESPESNIVKLLRGNSELQANIDRAVAAGRAKGLGFRLTETNSCYRGGKPGVSDALASALWGADLMLDLAARGGKGINFHGGPGKAIAASNSDRMPGAVTDADRETARKGTFYSPFAGSPSEGFGARPIFYGMMLAERFAGTTLLASAFDPGGVNASAYAAKAQDGWRVAVINKDPGADLDMTIDLGRPVRGARVWRLKGPALDATSGVALAGAEVASGDAAWAPAVEAHLRAGPMLALSVPRASAALVFVDA